MQRKKTEIVTARMTPEVKYQLQAWARDANMTLTNYLIICGLGQEIVRIDGLDNLLSELKAQGRNLNQLTTLANMGQLTVSRGNDLISEYAGSGGALMATFTAIQCKKQSASSMRGVIDYVEQEEKTCWGDAWLVTGSDCVPQSAFIEMQMTKERFHKTGGTQFYHFVQSFSAEDDITPPEVNAISLEFAQRQFPGFEVVVATHVDTGHLHNHFVVNSVSCTDGHKLHQSYSNLLTHRKVNDEICLAHGLSVLSECDFQKKKKRMKPGEYQAGLRGDSWKLDLIQAINEALEYSITREDFITNMEMEGYEVSWSDARKHITFICPNGRRCRDSSLHDETFLKENLEALFTYRQVTNFRPQTPEPDEGWLGELATGWFQVLADLERDDEWQFPVTSVWTDSKQRRREAIKKMAMGQKLSDDQHWEQAM